MRIFKRLFKSTSTAPAMPPRVELKREWREARERSGSGESYFDFVRRKRHELNKQQAGNGSGDSPWLENKAWRTNRIHSNAATAMIALWSVAVLWNGICIPSVLVVPEELANGNYAALLILLFPPAGLFILVKAVQATLQWRRFGKLDVVLDPFPGSIGGHVGGYLDIKDTREPQAGYEVSLECVYTYMAGTSKSRRRRERILWAEKGRAAVTPLGDRLRLSFRFDVPENLAESDVRQTGDYYFWRLNVSADLAGADLNREFNIPVFKTGRQSEGALHDISAQVEAGREQQVRESQRALLEGRLEETALARVLRYRQRHGQAEFYFPMFRNKLLTSFALVFAGGFGFAVYSMYAGLDDGGLFDILTILFSIPFALVVLLTAVAAVYLPLNNLTVRTGNGRLEVLRRVFVIPVYRKVLRPGDVEELTVKRSGSRGQGVEKVENFKIAAAMRGNSKVTVAEGVEGEDLAVQFKDFLARQLGIG